MEKKLPKAQFGTLVKNTFKGAVSGGKAAYKAVKAAKLADETAAALKAKRAAAAKKASETRAANKAAKEQAAANAAKPKATKATTTTKPAAKTKNTKSSPEKKTSEKSPRLLRGHNPYFEKQGVKFKDEPGPKTSTVRKPTNKKTVKSASSGDNLTKNVKRGIIGTATTAVAAAVIKDKIDKAKRKLPSGADVLKTQGKYKFAKGGSAKRK